MWSGKNVTQCQGKYIVWIYEWMYECMSVLIDQNNWMDIHSMCEDTLKLIEQSIRCGYDQLT